MATTIPFLSVRDSSETLDPLSSWISELPGEGTSWPGVQVYQGSVSGWSVKDICIDGHTIFMSMNEAMIEIRANGKTIPMVTQGMLFVPAGTPITSTYTDKFSFCMVVLERQQFSIDLGLVSPVLGCLEELQDIFLVQLVRSLVQLAGETDANIRVIEVLRKAISLRILSISGEVRANTLKGGLAVSHMKKVMEYIEKHIGEDLSIDVLAELVNLSPTHFARAFRASVGVPPHRHIIKLRLDRARIALRYSNESLSEVASKFGFSDHSHFTRLFKEHFGCTPSAYRKI